LRGGGGGGGEGEGREWYNEIRRVAMGFCKEI
jgi:hypothetical protein